ncbi:MAG: DUF2252 family protein, partial [Candidatus Eremiobacteraeota bacterium]|nr:DUF2252 family protein [Candidatus Eremiobacteraeota bacterium]
MLRQSNEGRLASLIPVRHARMQESLFTYLRGFPSMMAYDLAHSGQTTQIHVQICGDAHLENFGIFATPERNVIFDINDFDETTIGPWEWDVKRLAVSAYVAAKVNGFSSVQCEQIVEAAVAAYRSRIWLCTEQRILAVWYSRTDASELLQDIGSLDKKKAPKNAPEDTHELVCEEYTTGEGVGERIADQPPKLFHEAKGNEVVRCTREALETYPDSLREDVRALFQCYEIADIAIKVVGIGSVATRCGVALFKAHDDDGLVLQAKEARPSVFAPFVSA